jgi:hypothetical protein
MIRLIFLTHWSCAFIEEQFYALYRRLNSRRNCVYFTDWHNRAAVRHLLSLFEPTVAKNNMISYDNTFYPDITTDSPNHQLVGCTHANSLFIVYFNPRSLAFFRRSINNRFPTRYVWWQVEQTSNAAFFSDATYWNTIRGACGVLNVSHFNDLPLLTVPSWYAPFSRDAHLLQYTQDDGGARLALCQHQKKRLIQDNPQFAAALPVLGDLLLLGSCDAPRRQEFKQLCVAHGLTLQHPYAFNYLFAHERQEFICEFVRRRHADGKQAVAVNVHQHQPAMLEQAKIYLLLANGCDIVVSECSRNAAEDALVMSACEGRLVLGASLADVAERAAVHYNQPWEVSDSAKTVVDLSWQTKLFERLLQQLMQLL